MRNALGLGFDSRQVHDVAAELHESTTRRDGAVNVYRIDKDGRWVTDDKEQKEKELDEAAKKFERTIGSNKPPEEK